MSDEKTWFRVIDPLNPLCGCDVRGVKCFDAEGNWNELHLTALRRIDVMVGDRPYQLRAGDNDRLNIAIVGYANTWHTIVEISPLQDDVIILADDRPYGRCLDESSATRADGYTLRAVRYERATQIALDDYDGTFLATRTFYGHPDDLMNVHSDQSSVWDLFEQNVDPEEIKSLLNRRD